MSAATDGNVVLLEEIRRVRELVDPAARLTPKLFEAVCQEFLVYAHEASRDRRTRPSSVRILRRHLDGRLLHEIDVVDVQAFIQRRLEAGICRATVNRNRSTLSAIFNFGIARCYALNNPVQKVRKFRESPGRTRFLSKEEADKLLAVCPPHLRILVLVALNTGGRLSELVQLRWSDVDLETGMITFRKETTKTGRGRVVPLVPDLASLLQEMKKAREHLTVFGWDPDHVFTYGGDRIKSVRTAFVTARHKAGLDEVHFHDLRHTFASWYVQNGGDIYRLQRLLGHTSITLTERYSHLSEDFLQQAVAFIGAPGTTRPPVQRPPAAAQAGGEPSDVTPAAGTAPSVPPESQDGGLEEAPSSSTLGMRLLMDLRAIFASEHARELPTRMVVDRLNRMGRWSWIGADTLKASHQLGKLLREIGVSPKQIHWKGTNEKGYRVEDVATSFVRHLRNGQGASAPSPDGR